MTGRDRVVEKERTSLSPSPRPRFSTDVYSWGKIFLAANDGRQRLPVVVTPINNPFFTSILFFPPIFSPLSTNQFPRLPLRSICLQDCSGDHISPHGTRTIGEKTQEPCNSQRGQNRGFLHLSSYYQESICHIILLSIIRCV